MSVARNLGVLVHLADERADLAIGEFVHAVAEEAFVLRQNRQRGVWLRPQSSCSRSLMLAGDRSRIEGWAGSFVSIGVVGAVVALTALALVVLAPHRPRFARLRLQRARGAEPGSGRRADSRHRPTPNRLRPHPQQPVFRTGINFVRVDVIVTDKTGNPVSDLKPGDFEVTETATAAEDRDVQARSRSTAA